MTAPAAQAGLPGSGAAPAATGNKSTQTNAASEPLSGAVNTQTIPHTVKRGESVASLARHYLAESAFMQRSDLENAVRQANGLRADALQPGETVTIPGIPVSRSWTSPCRSPKTSRCEVFISPAIQRGVLTVSICLRSGKRSVGTPWSLT